MKYIISERQYQLISETLDTSSLALRRRLSLIEKLIDEELAEIHKEGGSEFTDLIEFMNIVINIVVDRVFTETGGEEELDEEELKEFIEEHYGDYILSMFPHDLEGDEEDNEDFEEDEDYEEGEDEEDDEF